MMQAQAHAILDTDDHMKGLLDVRITDVIGELVDLAAKHTNVNAEYRIFPMSYYNPNRASLREDYGSIWGDTRKSFTLFWQELRRLQAIVTKPLDEPVLPDNELIFGGYHYVMNGIPRECEHYNGENNLGISVLEYKERYGVTRIKRCDVTGRINRLPRLAERPSWDRNTEIKTDNWGTPVVWTRRPRHWDKAGRTIVQARRRPRCSHKIRKVWA